MGTIRVGPARVPSRESPEAAVELLLEYGQKAALEAARPLADILEAEGDTAGALAVLKRATEGELALSSPQPERPAPHSRI